MYFEGDAQDYVTFALAPGQYVSHASVSHWESWGRITFIGQHASILLNGPAWVVEDWTTSEADMSEIGPIQAIVLSDAMFDDIRITVVPEPATWGLFVLGSVVLCFRRRVSSIIPHRGSQLARGHVLGSCPFAFRVFRG